MENRDAEVTTERSAVATASKLVTNIRCITMM